MRVQVGKRTAELADEEVRARAATHDRVHLDVGTGDGAFVYRRAREVPGDLWIGVEPVAEAMARTSGKASRKPAKGGAPNALFVVAALAQLPTGLDGIADALSVNYPWGSLLEAILGQSSGLGELARLARPAGCTLTVLLNATVLDDDAYMSRLGLDPSAEALGEILHERYRAWGWDVVEDRCLGDLDPPHRTTWGQRLVKGSGRGTRILRATRQAGPPPPPFP